MSTIIPYTDVFTQISNRVLPQARYPAFDDTWAVEYEAREAMIAVRDGNNAEFFRLYPENAQHKDELFVVACDFGNLVAAQYLYQQGANVNGENLPDDCPFMFAMRSRNLEMIAWMLTLPDMNADVQMDCDGYYNGLAFAIDNNFPLPIIDQMIECGASISEDNGIFYPLSMAAHKNNAPAAALLLLRGADWTYVDDDDQSVAFYARGALKTALENWSLAATEIMSDILNREPSFIYRVDFVPNVMIFACTLAAEEAAEEAAEAAAAGVPMQ
jgi:hypothetical protein